MHLMRLVMLPISHENVSKFQTNDMIKDWNDIPALRKEHQTKSSLKNHAIFCRTRKTQNMHARRIRI